MEEKHVYLVYPVHSTMSEPCAAFLTKKDAKRFTNRFKHNVEYDIEKVSLNPDFIETTTQSAYCVEIGGDDHEVGITLLTELSTGGIEASLRQQYLIDGSTLYTYVLAEDHVEALKLATEIRDRLISEEIW